MVDENKEFRYVKGARTAAIKTVMITAKTSLRTFSVSSSTSRSLKIGKM